MPLLLRVLLLGSGLLAASCADPAPMPGTPLGTYRMEAFIESNSCGNALGASNPLILFVDLSRENDQLHWRQNGMMMSGKLDSEARTSIVSTQSGPVGQAGAGGGCSMARTDTLAVKLGSEAPPVLTGSLTFAFEGDTSSCADQLVVNGGFYDALPCQIAYKLAAEQSKAP